MLVLVGTYWWLFGLSAIVLGSIAIWAHFKTVGSVFSRTEKSLRSGGDLFGSFEAATKRMFWPALCGFLASVSGLVAMIGLIIMMIEHFKSAA